jgi:cholest-4-en-3-one 26-monooxygenase
MSTTNTNSTSLDDIDVQSNDVYVNGPPVEQFNRLRAEAPVFRHAGTNPTDVDWFWALTRHDDITMVSRQWQSFSAADGVTMMRDRPDMEMARMMIEMDPPEHTRVRGLVNRGFTPRAIKLLADHYIEVTKRLVAEAIEECKSNGEIDFVTKVAAELPLIAIAEMLGIPVEDRHRVFDWSNRMIASSDPDYSGGMEDAAEAAAEIYVYAQSLASDRRENPQDDIISILVSAEDGDALDEHEFNIFVLLLAVAGNETTRNAISHGVIAMIEHPDQWQLLRSRPELVDSAVEEICRWATPVNAFRRTAQSDVTLHGTEIKAGDNVVMYYVAANHDPEVFTDPHVFDITRSPNPHLTFGGGGPHFCLGANLARLEMRALFAELADKCETIELTGEIKRLRSSFINGVKTLPVRLT